jgi:hypothetical protein
MAKNKTYRVKRESSRDRLTAEISIKVKRPKGVRITKRVLEQAIDYKLNHKSFADPRGFKLRIISWTNPTRNPSVINRENGLPLNAPRSYGPDKERWRTLRGPLLQASKQISEDKIPKIRSRK